MGSIQNTVHYCCVSRDNRIVYTYNRGDHDAENLAALCLEKTPNFHKWYFETIGKRTFGFLMEDGFVYFAIVDEGFRNPSVLEFLEHLRDEFKKAAKRNSRGSFSGINSINVQDQLVPVIRRLVASLEHVATANNDWKAEETASSALTCLSSSSPVEQIEAANSTKAPLLGRSSKQEKRKAKDHHHVIAMKDVELEEHRKSTDKGNRSEACVDSDNPAGAMSSSQKDYVVARRGRSGSHSMERKWRRQVQIVLAVDAAICLTLFGIWLAICQGIECTRS